MSLFRLLRWPALLVLLQTSMVMAQDRPCDASSPFGPSRDLYCMDLVAAPGLAQISGRVELGWPAGPFTVSVNPEGRIRFRLSLFARELPSPASLGNYGTYVAWAASPMMDSVINLGPVGNGGTRLGTIDLEKFIFLVTAERSSQVRRPSRRAVLRGQSPATRLFPPDLLQLSLGSMSPAPSAPHRHGTGAEEKAAASPGWTTVPMPPGITMLPAEMALRPVIPGWLPAGSAPARRGQHTIRLRDGDTLQLEAGTVERDLFGHRLIMFSYNGQHPGPLLEVKRNSRVSVRLVNHLPQATSVHWHGIRLENTNDGTPGLTQSAVPPGGEQNYQLRFPDPGIYWYHPHVREDLQQELGLYGNILVRDEGRDTYGPANREAVLMLDDILISDQGMVPLGEDSPTHALMGRFGNLFLVNGEPLYRLRVDRGEIVRFFLTNAAGARTFNLSFPGARMKLVGSDIGTYGKERWVQSVVLAPAERYVIQVRFDRPGMVALVNRVRGLDHLYGRFFDERDTLGLVQVAQHPVARDLGPSFQRLRENRDAATELERYRLLAPSAPEKTLVLDLKTSGLPSLTERLMQLDSIYFPPVEWSGTMPMMNWASTGHQVRWILRDPAGGRENMDIDWHFHRGAPVRIHLVNQRQSMHAMQHPIHLHGQRFLILAVNGEPNQSLAWKDTVLVPAGGTVDILLDPSNPGRWMAHCHIAEHLSAGMMMAFNVE